MNYEDYNIKLSNYLKIGRTMQNLSQEELANQLGISRNCYITWEKNPIEIDFNTYIKICDILNLKPPLFFLSDELQNANNE